MSRGYLVMAQGDYLDMAIALAKSIKQTQSTVNNISIIVDCDIDVTEHSAVDDFIELPTDMSGDDKWKIHNRCQFYDLSPYDETVILDADMLFLSDVSGWWDMMSKYNMLITSKVKTYRDDWVDASPYRRAFTANNMPNTYSAFTYFKKSQQNRMFFTLLKSIITNWEQWSIRYIPEQRQRFPSIDLAMAIAVKILDIESEVTTSADFPTFTHMKGGCQGWKTSVEKWDTVLNRYNTEQGIKLGPYLQSGILHYVQKDFI
jgi:hypothetical protein